jgi:hypothetical protein
VELGFFLPPSLSLFLLIIFHIDLPSKDASTHLMINYSSTAIATLPNGALVPLLNATGYIEYPTTIKKGGRVYFKI